MTDAGFELYRAYTGEKNSRSVDCIQIAAYEILAFSYFFLYG